MRDLWQLSAVETVAAIKRKAASATEVTQSVLARIAQTKHYRQHKQLIKSKL
jgi:Asp-tRNA(Asn)/Glu-tRNA(Gln) amidotransferase A subunit family amidase